ncbi:site-specific integrase [Pseudolabrys taiwanensis]|uniref:Site-specific integrase n=1 Tax=Pseudolabrys taiwanensis TaxID=331696 RepID=A0A345ZXC5_9HYPH|nr:site-specific integrase [Pseudolabrys taiwanensis]AXK81572.1 site-specific integrase [Pseudolabrys taiwanensis]
MRVQSRGQLSLYTAAGERKYVNEAERNALIAAARACPSRKLRTFCLTLVYTGCRISEALAISGRSLELASGFIVVRSLKKRNGAIVFREVPVPPQLLEELLATHDLSEPDKDKLWPWCRAHAWCLIKGLMADAGIADGIHATPKGLRHGFGLHAVRSGVPINFIQRWLGHARMETTAIYLQAMGVEEREIAARMWA